MPHFRIPRRLTIFCVSFLCGCAPPAPVYCHDWDAAEKLNHYRDDTALPHDNSLHEVIKDYERVCAQIN